MSLQISEMKIGMKLLKLLASGFIFIIAMATALDENANNKQDTAINFRLPANVIPTHYDIFLHLYIPEDYYLGVMNASIIVHNATRTIKLHSTNLTFFSVTVNNDSVIYLAENKYFENWDIAVFSFPKELSPGNYTLSVTFYNTITRAAIFKTVSRDKLGKDRLLYVSRIQFLGARKLFPCWDEPAFTASFNIFIYHSTKYTVVCNTLLHKERMVRENDLKVTSFDTTFPIAAYLIEIMIFELYYGLFLAYANFRYSANLEPYLKFADLVKENITSYLIEIGQNHLEGSADLYHVAIPDYPDNILVKWSLAFYREADITYNEKLDGIDAQIKTARSIAYGIAYQWTGNLVSPTWWNYLWLNEGLTTLLALKAINKVLPELRMTDLFVVQIQQESLRLDIDSMMMPLVFDDNSPPEVNSILSFSYYLKAPAIMRMIQNVVTEEAFWSGVNMYFTKYKHSSASFSKLWTILQSAFPKQFINTYLYRTSRSMDTWTTRQHYPVVNVTRISSSLVRISHVNAEHFDSWSIPISVAYSATKSDPNFDFRKIWLDQNHWLRTTVSNFIDISLEDEKDNWIIINLQQIGYYRVNYNIDNWHHIAKYLNYGNYTVIHVLNRAQIIDDAFYFLTINVVELSTFLKIAQYLQREIDFIAWYPMIKALEYMSCFFPFLPESTYIKEKLLQTLVQTDLLEQFHFEDHLTSCLRQEIRKWACTLGSSEYKISSHKLLKLHLSHHLKVIAPRYKHWVYCRGLMEASGKTWNEMLLMYTNNTDKDILKYLACSENFDIISNYMQLITEIGSNATFQERDRVNIFHSIVARHARNNSMLDYMLTNFNDIKPKEINTLVASVDIINHVYSIEQIEKITEFLEFNLKFNFNDNIGVTIELNEFLHHTRIFAKIYNCLGDIKSLNRKLLEKLEKK